MVHGIGINISLFTNRLMVEQREDGIDLGRLKQDPAIIGRCQVQAHVYQRGAHTVMIDRMIAVLRGHTTAPQPHSTFFSLITGRTRSLASSGMRSGVSAVICAAVLFLCDAAVRANTALKGAHGA